MCNPVVPTPRITNSGFPGTLRDGFGGCEDEGSHPVVMLVDLRGNCGVGGWPLVNLQQALQEGLSMQMRRVCAGVNSNSNVTEGVYRMMVNKESDRIRHLMVRYSLHYVCTNRATKNKCKGIRRNCSMSHRMRETSNGQSRYMKPPINRGKTAHGCTVFVLYVQVRLSLTVWAWNWEPYPCVPIRHGKALLSQQAHIFHTLRSLRSAAMASARRCQVHIY